MLPGDRFEVVVSLNALPPGVSQYEAFDLYMAFAGISSERKSDVTWPDCGFSVSHYKADFVAFGCAVPVGDVTSAYVGEIGESDFVCHQSGSVTLEHETSKTHFLMDLHNIWVESGSAVDQLVINCGDPVAGDVDCSSLVSSVDAALMLQRGANLVEWLNCPQFADVNLDRNDNAIDSLLTLQYTAGLLGGLPVIPSE
jgi:hypothetical protein